MPKQTVIRPTGVVTQPNEYGDLPPGTLSTGDGIQIRRSHVIEPRNSFQEWMATPQGLMVGTSYPVKVWPTGSDNRVVILHNGTTYQTVILDGTPPANSFVLDGPDSLTSFNPGKTHITRTRKRIIFSYSKYPVIWDPTDATYTARQAGIAPLFLSDITPTTGGSIWLHGNYVGYAAVVRRTDADGYVVRGDASNKLIEANGGFGSEELATVKLTWPTTAVLKANDVIELYRLPQQTSADLLGDEYRLALEYKLSAADIVAGFVDITDTCLETALSSYLYVNPSQKGAEKTYKMPPPSSDVCTFKNATFYVSTALWHQVVVRIPNKWGPLTGTEQFTYGIGERETTGTGFTNGVSTFTVADATGIKIGQRIQTFITGIDGSTVANVVGTLVTASSPATMTFVPPEFVIFTDVISIDGVALDARNAAQLSSELQAALVAGTIQTTLYGNPTLNLDAFNVEGQTLTFQNAVPPASFTIKATNGQNYSPPLAEFSGAAQTSTNDPRTDRVHYSESDQPENVPPGNRFPVGSGTILKLWATQDSLFAFCTDGIFRIDGDGDDWSLKPVDPDTILLAPDAVDSMDNQIYAFTTAGLISLSDSGGVKKISAPFIDEDLRELWNQFTEETPPLPYTWGVQLACDKFRNEVWLNFNDYTDDGLIKTWIWNVNTETFVTQSAQTPVTVVYDPDLRSIMTGDAVAIEQYDPDNWMATDVEFNSIFADDLGLLKQWIDVTLFFEDLGDVALFLPRFEGLEYDDAYEIPATAGAFDHVVAPLLTAACNKHVRFGYVMDEAEGESDKPYYKLKGLTYRYRLAAEPLRQ